MRVPSFSAHSHYISQQQTLMQGLLKVNQQMSTGQVIRQGYEDLAVYNNALRLDEEEATLTQVSKTAVTAKSFADNTDTVLSDMTKAFDKIKERLVYATNNVHSTTSYQAIATELKALKNNLVGLANTSINGQYLLSGTALTTKPIDANGVYQGNANSLNAFVGSGVQYPQNIDGYSLFLGDDSDYKRQLTTNIRLLNQTKLTQDDNPGDYPIATTDSIKDLTGTTGDSYFYVSGRQSDGTAFKTKLTMSEDGKVSDLLTAIKHAYNDRVDLSINTLGQIEIKDQALGSSQLQFEMFASNVDITTSPYDGKLDNAQLLNDMTEIVSPATQPAVIITEFTQSSFTTSGANPNESMMGDAVQFTRKGSTLTSNVSHIVKETNSYANLSTKLEDVSSRALAGTHLALDITTISGNAQKWDVEFDNTSSAYPYIAGTAISSTSIDDLIAKFQGESSGDFSVIVDGTTHALTGLDFSNVLSLDDIASVINTALVADGANVTMSVTPENQFLLTNTGVGATPTLALPTPFTGVEADLNLNPGEVGNSTAVVVSSHAVSNGSTAIDLSSLNNGSTPITDGSFDIDVDGTTLSVTGLDFTGATTSKDVVDILNKNASFRSVGTASLDSSGNLQITGMTSGVTATLSTASASGTGTDVSGYLGLTSATLTDGRSFEVYDATGIKATASSMTYGQLSQVVSMITAGILPTQLSDFSSYESQSKSAAGKIETTLNQYGQFTVHDKTTSPSVTKSSVSIYDPEVTDFSTTTGASLSFASNNAIAIDDPKVSFFALLDEAIAAVEAGRTRPDASKNDPRNKGIQNTITALDHLTDHIERQHTKNGAIANTLLSAQTRSETLILQTKTLKSSFMDTDIAKASLELSQLTTTYSAAMAALQKINGLSLVNYIS